MTAVFSWSGATRVSCRVRQRFPGCAEPLPAVFRLVQGRLLVCARAAEIARCAAIAELAALIRRGCMADDAAGTSEQGGGSETSRMDLDGTG